jgi:hypothetical protein
MAAIATKPEVLSRADAIGVLRDALVRIAGPDASICRAAAERGVFCRGFRRYDDEALRAEYKWLEERRPGLTREQLEDLGDRWQLARQEVRQAATACDVQAAEHDTCGGWDDFSSDELARFIFETTKRRVTVAAQ